MPKYEICPKCQASAVHLAMATVHDFYGYEDDQEGNASEYESEEAPNAQTVVVLFAHVCYSCGFHVDVGIEYPRDKVINTGEPQRTLKTFKPENIPFLDRLKIHWDFDSLIKSIWLTGYLLITWEWDGCRDTLWRTLDFTWYQGGSYE